jgi:hypothetical protein
LVAAVVGVDCVVDEKQFSAVLAVVAVDGVYCVDEKKEAE